MIAQTWLGRMYLKKGMTKEAIAIFEKNKHPLLALAYSASGQRDEALRVLEEWKIISSQKPVDPVYLAEVCLGVGDKEEASKYLEEAWQEHYPRLLDFIKDPLSDSIREDPRFKDLPIKMKLEKWAK